MYWNDNSLNRVHEAKRLNSNIICIEMIQLLAQGYTELGWIVTLDVLKSKNRAMAGNLLFCWIVTLDVLKYPSSAFDQSPVKVE